MNAILQLPKSHGYGLVLRRRIGDCLVMDGPSRVHFLQGDCECLIVHQSDTVAEVNVCGQSIDLPGPALIFWIRGGGRVGVQAPKSTRALRGELLGGVFDESPLVAALAHSGRMASDDPVMAITTRKSITHLRRSDEGLSWRQ